MDSGPPAQRRSEAWTGLCPRSRRLRSRASPLPLSENQQALSRPLDKLLRRGATVSCSQNATRLRVCWDRGSQASLRTPLSLWR